MKRAIIIALVACAAPRPKTEASMRAARLAEARCRRACITGQWIPPIEPQDRYVLEDCCYDANGLTWSSCAWNGTGRYMTLAQIMAPSRVASSGCGGDGWPDCEASR